MWHALPISEVFQRLNTNSNGLSEEEAEKRRKIYGKNEIKLKRKSLFLETIKEQVTSPLVLLLIFSAALSFYIGELNEGFLISFVVFLYTFLDFVQQYKSEKIISLLKKESKAEAIVRREGKVKKINSTELVPGDIVILKQGSKVPADIRIISCRNLYVDESILTGESKPVRKEEKVLEENIPLQDRRNMLYMGTFVVRGYAEGVVVATGNSTELGKIYKSVEEISHKKTPLEIEIDKFGKLITAITVLIIAIVLVLSYAMGIFSLYDALIFSIALGVAVIPEGLPTVLTVIYTIALHRIYKSGALVKRLDSVETLGSVDVIFTDKTGTLTLNQLTIREFWFSRKFYEVSGKGYEPSGGITRDGEQVKLDEIFLFVEACINCVESELVYDNGWKVIGDPLEGALICLAYKAGLKTRLKVINVFEFDRTRKRMSVVTKKGDDYVAFVKGAPEKILEITKYIQINDRVEPIFPYIIEVNQVINKFAERGYRVLAIGYKKVKESEVYNLSDVEKDLILLGIIALEDPIREEVVDAISFAKKANIDVVIITGDHPETAKIVARKVGVQEKCINSQDIKKMPKEKVVDILKEYKIVARADPSDKLKIVKAFKEKGFCVAMTGDGVNDAAALKLADIGISLSDASDIAKEAADMILMNNSFKSIIEAIKEGRRILYDLKAFLAIVLSVNIALLVNILLSFFISRNILLQATHILIVNLALEAVNSMIIGTNEVSQSILLKKPKKTIVDSAFILELVLHGAILGVLSYVVAITTQSVFCILLYLAIGQYAIFFYYQKKYNILFAENRWFYIAMFTTLSIIFLSSVKPLNQYTNLAVAPAESVIISLLTATLTFFLYFVIVNLNQVVPERHHKSANSDRHHILI